MADLSHISDTAWRETYDKVIKCKPFEKIGLARTTRMKIYFCHWMRFVNNYSIYENVEIENLKYVTAVTKSENTLFEYDSPEIC